MTALSFRTSDRGETLFFPPRSVPWSRKAYVVTRDEDVEKLSNSLNKFYIVFFCAALPLTVVVFGGLFGFADIFPLILTGLGVGVLSVLIFKYAVVHPIVGKYRTSPEKTGFGESQRIQADTYGWGSLTFMVSTFAVMFGLGLFQLYSGGTTLGICLVVGSGLFGLQTAYLMALKRRRAGGKPAARSS